jgi:hypothetical protein
MSRRLGTIATFVVMLVAGALLASGVFQFYAPSESPVVEAPPVDLGRVRVEVRNAGGRSGMARRATDYLRDLGFDVVYFGNADQFDQQETVVLDRMGRMDKARAVAEVMGAATVLSEADSTLYLDVTVLLGAEWDVIEEEAPTDEVKPWWDVTRWMRKPAGPEPETGNEP